MSKHNDIILKGGILADGQREEQADLAICDGVITATGALEASARQVLDVRGLHILPGVIDTQVHFREPGDNHAEFLQTGSRAAVLGGVTAVFEMPNTSPPTISEAALGDKLKRAHGQMFCDYAFYVGGVAENVAHLSLLERQMGCCGVKVFMGSSTGGLLADDDETIAAILAQISRRASFHSEDEMRLRARKDQALDGQPATHQVWRDVDSALLATERLLKLARAAGKQVHVLHITTGQEIALLGQQKDIASVEVTPQHLTLAAPECYEQLGTYAQMNPPIRGAVHREALWKGIENNIVDVIGSDHAPHMRSEKDRLYPLSPSGMPGVQTLVPIMLDHVNAGRLSLARFIQLTSTKPARLFRISGRKGFAVGADAALTIVDLGAARTIEADWIASPCGWTPFDGRRVKGWPVGTLVGGEIAMWHDEVKPRYLGKPLSFL